MSNEMNCRQKFENSFITNGAAPIVIHIIRLDKDRDATMVFNDTEGPDTAIIFTPKQNNSYDNLLKTDYYLWDNKMFFVYEDVLIARDVSYIKQHAYQCNAKVHIIENNNFSRQDSWGGYFISSLRSYVDTDFQQKLNVTDKEKPVLIMPAFDWLKIGLKVEVGGKPWKVIDYDIITNPGIAYISLERDFFKKTDNIIETDVEPTLHAGIDHTFETQEGYFNSSSPLKIKSRSATKVVFEIPYGIENLTISIMKDGKVQDKVFKVVV
jgi:hypothetical protein